MKKIILTIAIVLGIAMGSFAQNQYGFWFFRPEETKDEGGLFNRNETIDDEELFYFIENWNGGGLFSRGRTLEGMSRDGGTYSLCFPGHNFTTHWNGGSQGHDDDLVPLGGGALLLVGFGAAYALTKRNKKD